MRWLAAAPRLLTPIALFAAALAIVAPSAELARHSDLLLAALVLATALGISHRDLARLKRHAAAIALLSVVPVLALGPIAWVVGRPFSPTIQHGLLGVGLSSSEVAAVGLVALAGADVTIALGAVAGSLIVAAVIGPLAIGWIAGGGHTDSVALLGRLVLVVIVPLGCGVIVRSFVPRLAALDRERDGVAAIAVALLVYAALSGTHGAHNLAAAALASLAFLAVCAGLGEVWRRHAATDAAVPGALAIAMRDFAVAAALATQAFGTSAGTVPGVYGVLMLVTGAVAAGKLSGSPGSAVQFRPSAG